MSGQKSDIYLAIYDIFRLLEQDIMEECTFRELLRELIINQPDSYTILLKLWEEHGYIKILRQLGKPRSIELGPVYERNFYAFI